MILNVAASVSFDEPLKQALTINYFGAKLMLDLAKECKKLQVFSHVSTTYVNCNRPNGLIEETIYPLENDFE